MAKPPCTMFVALGLLDLLSGPPISSALNDLARTTPLTNPHNRKSRARAADELRGPR
jgi:hypothetical protein